MSEKLSTDTKLILDGILACDRVQLARGITLIESLSKKHFAQGQLLLQSLMPRSGNSVRIGITGAPGAGKSTFIDTFGSYLCDLGKKVAVLAIDPTSSVSHGSILGDKTRMENLSRIETAFIRPSPSKGTLGGVATQTRETIMLCEAAGYDIILIETVGVGQSETTVRGMCDIVMLLLLPGGGDELQGIKKGNVELADIIVINKADGESLNIAEITKREYSNALSYLNSPTEGWVPVIHTASALQQTGITEIWNSVGEFINSTVAIGSFGKRRKNQLIEWMNSIIEIELKRRLKDNDAVTQKRKNLENELLNEKITPNQAAIEIVDEFLNRGGH